MNWKHMVAALLVGVSAAAGAQAVSIDHIDPPNWWAQMPAPMLLVHGEGLNGATFSVSDRRLKVKEIKASENGHWAEVWLSAAPTGPETVQLEASRGSEHARAAYRFAKRRPENSGFAGFNARDVMYLIMTDRFADGDAANDGARAQSSAGSADAVAERAKIRGWHGGDLRGIAAHLDYLQQMGVTAVWTTPVYQNHGPDSYHGYGATDLYAVDEHYGSLEDLQALAAALHSRGMKMVLDTVPNHIGPRHPWVQDEPAPDWFHGTQAQHVAAQSKFRALIDPHASAADRTPTLHGWFANVLPDMNTENPAVAQYLRQNTVWWIEQTGADALRIDTYPYVDREFWHAFHAELSRLYPHLTAVGETFDRDPVFVSSYAGGVTRAGVDTGLYTPFDFPTYFAVRDVFAKGAPMSQLEQVLAQDSLYPHAERLPLFVGNHDVTRLREVADEPAARQALAYIFTTRGMPQLYSGDEIAMRGKEDPDNRRDFPGGWPGDRQSAFAAATRTPEQQRMYMWVSDLARVRREHPALACGAEQVLAVDADTIVYLRDGSRVADASCGAPTRERVIVALHRGGSSSGVDRMVPAAETWLAGCSALKALLHDGEASATAVPAGLHLMLRGNATLVAACAEGQP